MLRKIHTSNNRRKFLHEQTPPTDIKSNNITRPPTSHPYSALRNIRSHDSLHPPRNFLNHSQHDKSEKEGKQGKDERENRQMRVEFVPQGRVKDGLPKVYLHLLTEIRILFRNRDKQEDKMLDSLLHSLSRRITDLNADNEEQKSRIKDIQVDLIRYQEQQEELMKRLRKMQGGSSPKVNRSSARGAKRGEYQLVMENVRLEQLNAAYLSRIEELQERGKEKTIEIKKEIHQNQNTEILRYHNRISYLEMKLKNAEDKEAQLNCSLEQLQKQYTQLAESQRKLEVEKVTLDQRLGQWRQRAQMQLEDSEMHLTRQNFLLFSIKKLREVNKSLTEKLIHQGSGDGQVQRHEIEPNPYFQYQIDFFRSIRTIYFDARYKEFKLNLTARRAEALDATPFELEEQYLQYRRHQEVNLAQFSYFMPSFYGFIEESLTSEIASTRLKGNGAVSRIFIQILRAILNSKLNEFLMLSQQKYSRFPEFVYTWFERFYFNSELNDIAALQPYMQKPFPQDLFYRDLMNIKLDQSWQIITFREFLLEELSLEELYFYLMCQNLLFRRGSVGKQKQYQGDFCVLVEYNAAKSVLDMVLSDFESWNLSYLTSKMREKIVYRKNVEYIESGFFLRCLVEYYKIQRVNRYKYISKLCDEFRSQEKGLRFSSFVSVINRFTEVGIQQKMKLYRQCYCLGKGRITSDVIFAVCSEKLIFLRYLKLKCFYKLPLLTTQRSIRSMQLTLSKKGSQVPPEKRPIICLQPSDPYLYEIYTRMIKLLRSDSGFCSQLEKLGLVELLNQLAQMQKLFNDKQSTTDSSVLRCRHFMHLLSEMLTRIRLVTFSHFYELLEEDGKRRNGEAFWVDLQQADLADELAKEFTTALNTHDRLQARVTWKNKVYEFRLHHAARKIQRMVRKKFIAPFIELYKIIYSQFKNGEKPQK